MDWETSPVTWSSVSHITRLCPKRQSSTVQNEGNAQGPSFLPWSRSQALWGLCQYLGNTVQRKCETFLSGVRPGLLFIHPSLIKCLIWIRHLLETRPKCYGHQTLREERRGIMKTKAMASEYSKLFLQARNISKPCPLPSSPVPVKLPPALDAMVKPFINSILSCNYTVKQPEHSISAPQSSQLAAVHFEGNQKQWKEAFSS